MTFLSLVLSIATLSSPAKADLIPYSSIDEAFKSVSTCSGAVTLTDTYVARVVSRNEVILTSMIANKHNTLPIPKPANALKIQDNTLFILTSNSIQEWDILTGKMMYEVTSRAIAQTNGYDRATGMAFYGKQLVISHGFLGYSIYDTEQHKIVYEADVLREQLPHESILTAVTVLGDQAIFTAMGGTMPAPWQPEAFSGFVIVDLKTRKEVKKVTGLDPGSETIHIVDGKVIVNFGAFLHVFKLEDVLNKKSVRIQRIIFNQDPAGSYFGQFDVRGSKIYGCFHLRNPQDSVFTNRPYILDTSL